MPRRLDLAVGASITSHCKRAAENEAPCGLYVRLNERYVQLSKNPVSGEAGSDFRPRRSRCGLSFKQLLGLHSVDRLCTMHRYLFLNEESILQHRKETVPLINLHCQCKSINPLRIYSQLFGKSVIETLTRL